FEIWHQGELLGEFRTRLAGEMNVSNAGAVSARLHHLYYLPEKIAPAVAGCEGAARRQQQLVADARFRVFDDYGHHPEEIRATVEAMRRLGARRLLVAFQPHRFTRTQRLFEQFQGCFGGVDRLWVTGIYGAGEPE